MWNTRCSIAIIFNRELVDLRSLSCDENLLAETK